jgi:hypothetical protein
MAAEKGEVSFKYGQRQPRPAFRYRLGKGGDQRAVRFLTALTPYQGDPPVVEIESLVGKPGGRRVELEVTVGNGRVRIGYDLSDNSAWIR